MSEKIMQRDEFLQHYEWVENGDWLDRQEAKKICLTVGVLWDVLRYFNDRETKYMSNKIKTSLTALEEAGWMD